jgi:hypothetical protein
VSPQFQRRHITLRAKLGQLGAAVMVVAGLALTACSSSTPVGPVQSSVSFSTEPPSSTSTAAIDSGAGLSSPMQTAGTYTASDSSGNTARMVISLGTIQPANQITDNLMQACSSDITQIGSSLDRSLAVPITVSIQLTSSLSNTLGVSLVDQYLAVAGGPPEKVISTPIFFAEGYSDGSQCASPSMDPTTAGQITWNNAAAGIPHTWRGYLIRADAITPNDPTGAASDLHRLLVNPTVSLSETTPAANLNYITANSPFEVYCKYAVASLGNGRPLLAIDPSAVLNYGCSPA